MSDNLPDRVLGDLSGQAALFEYEPLRILALSDGDFAALVGLVRQQGESLIQGVRRYVGLLAWAAWHRYDEKRYREFVADFATRLGVEPRNVLDWRRAVVKKGDLPYPPVAGARSVAAKGAGQRAVTTKARSIPAASTEAPGKKSEGGGRRGATPAGSPIAPPSGQSSEGARVTPPRTGKGASSAPPLAPSDPSSEQLRSGTGGVAVPPGATPPESPNSLIEDGYMPMGKPTPSPAEDVPGSPDPAFQRPLNPPEIILTATNGEGPEPLLVSDADGLRWLRSKSGAAIRSLGDPWRPAIRARSSGGRWRWGSCGRRSRP